MHRDLQSIKNNNTDTQRTTSEDTASWRIELAEKPLELGFIDNLIFRGRDAGHSFIRLVDQFDNVRGELHGYSFDPDKDNIAEANFNPWKRVKHAFARSALPFNPNTVKVFHFGFDRTQHEELTTQTIMEGDKSEVIMSWLDAIKRGMDINAEEHEYRPLSILQLNPAQNCHTVTSDLISAIGIDPHNFDTHFAAPGFTNQIQTTPEAYFNTASGKLNRPLRSLYNAFTHWGEKLIPQISDTVRDAADDIRRTLPNRDTPLGLEGLHAGV